MDAFSSSITIHQLEISQIMRIDFWTDGISLRRVKYALIMLWQMLVRELSYR